MLTEALGMENECDMEALSELIRILSESSVSQSESRARATQTCKLCGGPARSFRDWVSELEYKISAICQQCQNRYFKP